MSRFTKAPHLQVKLSEFELSEIKKGKQLNPNEFNFDSSGAYSISMWAGFNEKTYRQELIHSDERMKKFNVYGGSEVGGHESFKGTLEVKTPEEWRRSMTSSFERR